MSLILNDSEESIDQLSSAREPVRLFALDFEAVRRIRVTLVSTWILLALGAAASHVLIHTIGTEAATDAGLFLSLGSEAAPGTWVSSTLLLACALLAVICALVARLSDPRWVRSWVILAIVFCFLSLDEVASIHERLSPRVATVLGDPSGVLTFAWVIPAVALGVVFLIVEIPLLRHLGAAGRRLVASGVIFIAGAIGLEMIEGGFASTGDRDTVVYDLLVTAEELLEFGAVMWAILILVDILQQWLDSPDVVMQPDRLVSSRDLRRASGHVGSPAVSR